MFQLNYIHFQHTLNPQMGGKYHNNNNKSLFTFPFLYNITMFSIFRKREDKLDSYKDTKI